MRFDNNSTGERMNQRWTPAKNVGSQEVSPFGLVEIATSTNPAPGALLHSVKRPTASSMSPALLAVNGPTPIPVNGHGSVTQDWPVFALYNTGDGTPVQGETWGSLINTFTLSKGKAGFTVMGQTLGGGASSRVRIQAGIPETAHLAKITGGVVRRASGVCTSATATIWEINGSDTLAATSSTITVYNPNGLPIIASDLCLVQRLGNGKWIVTELMGAMRDFWFRAGLVDNSLALNTAIPSTSLTGGTVWGGSSTLPVYWSSPVVLVQFPGYYRLQALLNVKCNFAQPTDAIHHYTTVTFTAYLNGVAMSAVGYVTFVYPALQTDAGPDSNGDTDFTHTFTGIDHPTLQCTVNGIVTKIGATAQTIDIRATAIVSSTGGPAIADIEVLSSSCIELKPIGYGDVLGAWVV